MSELEENVMEVTNYSPASVSARFNGVLVSARTCKLHDPAPGEAHGVCYKVHTVTDLQDGCNPYRQIHHVPADSSTGAPIISGDELMLKNTLVVGASS